MLPQMVITIVGKPDRNLGMRRHWMPMGVYEEQKKVQLRTQTFFFLVWGLQKMHSLEESW